MPKRIFTSGILKKRRRVLLYDNPYPSMLKNEAGFATVAGVQRRLDWFRSRETQHNLETISRAICTLFKGGDSKKWLTKKEMEYLLSRMRD